MRVEFINDEEFSIFINSCYCKINDYNDKDKIIDVVKNVISKYRNKFRLRGRFFMLYREEKRKTSNIIEQKFLRIICRETGNERYLCKNGTR